MKKFILLIISLLSISNFAFAADRGDQKEQKKKTEVTVPEAYDAIINNDIQSVARFLNQKEENLTLYLAPHDVFSNDFLLFDLALFYGRLEIVELFLMKGILKLLSEGESFFALRSLFHGFAEDRFNMETLKQLLELLIGHGIYLHAIYRELKGSDIRIEDPKNKELFEFLLPYEKGILLSAINMRTEFLSKYLSSFKNRSIKKIINKFLDEIRLTYLKKIEATFGRSKNVDDFKHLEKRHNLSNLLLLIGDFYEDIEKINEKDSKADEQLFYAFSKFKERYGKLK